MLFERCGYDPEKEYLHMEITVPGAFVAGDPPVGIVIRPRVEDDDRAVIAVMAEAFDEGTMRMHDGRSSRRRPTTRRSGSSLSMASKPSGHCSATSRTGMDRSVPSACAMRGDDVGSRERCCAGPS